MQRDFMNYDVVIVGAGPAGLSASIRLKQGKPDLSVCVVEKGSSIGAHILSGAVIETRALDELIPDWRERGAPLKTKATEDHFLYLTEGTSWRLPTPTQMHNTGNYIVSLGEVTQWLATQAEGLGVEIYPGFAVQEALFDEGGRVKGVRIGDRGINKKGEKTGHYMAGMDLFARQTLLAEGCRGSVSEEIMKRYDLRHDSDPQTYGLGLKEIWEVPAAKHSPGKVVHTVGWPLDSKTYGGSFVYHLDTNKVAIGFVIGLDYQNPYLNPFKEFQRFKTHPAIRSMLEGGKRLSYGARALNEGGLQSIPTLSFPGGALIGCSAGFLNVPKIKGTHTAMKSGMLAADAILEDGLDAQMTGYEQRLKKSWVWDELTRARNIRGGFKWGLLPGLILAGLDTYVFRGHAPWTFHHKADHETLALAKEAPKIHYEKPDDKVSFDLLSSVFLSNTNHEEDQPAHLKLRDESTPMGVNLALYDFPEGRYCPAGVYEKIEENGQPKLQINAQNCLHCKTCDIKDPTQNIHWETPEGGGGPHYVGM